MQIINRNGIPFDGRKVEKIAQKTVTLYSINYGNK